MNLLISGISGSQLLEPCQYQRPHKGMLILLRTAQANGLFSTDDRRKRIRENLANS